MAKPNPVAMKSTGPNMDPGKANPTGHQLDHISHVNGVGHDHDSTGYANGVGHAKFHLPDDDIEQIDIVSSISENVQDDEPTGQLQDPPKEEPLEDDGPSLEEQAAEIYDALFTLPALSEDDIYVDEMDDEFLIETS